MRYGYCRASATDQSVDIQVENLNSHAVEMIRTEKASGTSMNGRTELRLLLDFLRAGDELFVTRIDRLARSTLDFCTIVREIEERGARLVVTQQSIDTGTPAGKMMMHMLAAIGEFEHSLRKERQTEGISKAKMAGKYTGRKRTFDPDAVIAAHRKFPELGATALGRKLSCSKHTVYRLLKERGVGLGKAD